MKPLLFILGTMLCLFGCQPTQETSDGENKPVLTDLFGKQHFVPNLTEKQRAKLDSNLQVAENSFEKDSSEENFIWLGRRQAYRYKIEQAIETFTKGIRQYPNSYRLYRHRGHRYITVRAFDNAIADFEKAAALMAGKPSEIEPDGQPNAQNIPLSTTQFNVFYHLGLAHYLKGDFAKAETAYRACMAVSDNDDLKVATTDWLYMTFAREGKKKSADSLLALLPGQLSIIENDSYLNRLNMYRGITTPDQVLSPDPRSEDYDLSLATQGYGVGNWYLYAGDTIRAKDIFKKVLGGKHFTSFGFIAAEAEMHRLE
ncbi:MAG: tetratricopeptide repeat protein [Flammeovirgaceae bacterium]